MMRAYGDANFGTALVKRDINNLSSYFFLLTNISHLSRDPFNA